VVVNIAAFDDVEQHRAFESRPNAPGGGRPLRSTATSRLLLEPTGRSALR
jgi:hypothetical protein